MEIVKKFGSSPLTVKRAFRQLVDHGLCGRCRRWARLSPITRRTFAGMGSRSCTSGVVRRRCFLRTRSRRRRRRFHARIRPAVLAGYYEIDNHADGEGYRSLVDDLKARRLAGLIFATHPGPLIGTPLLARDGIPRVAISSDPWLAANGVAIQYVDGGALMQRALVLAAEAGASRVALLWRPQSAWREELDKLRGDAARLGVELTRRHVQMPALREIGSIEHCVYGLLDDALGRRPDALVITDDNFVDEATRAIARTGVRVPEELRVIAHCNYPLLPPAAVPVTRLGFDLRAMLERCIGVLSARRVGREAESVGCIPPLLEEELPVFRNLARPSTARRC